MSRAAALALGAVLAGFAVGFLFGGRVREELPGAVDTQFRGGKLVVTVDARQATGAALSNLLG